MTITDTILVDAGTSEGAIKGYLGGDNHENLEPVHDDEHDFDAVDFNKMVKGMAEVVKRIRPGNLFPVAFELASVLGNTPNQPAQISGWVLQQTMLMFKDATLIGITAHYSSPVTNGTLTVEPQLAGADSVLQAVLSVTNPSNIRAHQLPATAATAGDEIDASAYETVGVYITTDATFAPTVGRINGHLWFSIGEEEDI